MALHLDPVESFAHLIENIPTWMAQLDDLTLKCDEQYERFYKITQFGEIKLTRKRKNESTESLRPKDTTLPPHIERAPREQNDAAAAIAVDAHLLTQPPPDSLRPLASGNNLTVHDIGRKRKPASELSAAPSGHTRYRTKSMIIVYYDSAIQEGFESVVKNVACARNILRKGKTTATFKARMASMGVNPDVFTPGAPATVSPYAVLPGKVPPAFMRARLGQDSVDKSALACFDDADRDLEEAQNLCERAAHQFLRDGDSKIEIEGTRKRFEEVLKMAGVELERLKKEKQPVKEAREETEEEGPRVELPNVELLAPKIQIPPPPEERPKQTEFAATGAIEIDDTSDAESYHIDLSAIRRTIRRT